MRRSSVPEAALAVVLAGLVLALAWSSRRWPLIHDAAVMHYIAWLVGAGAVPYRDVFDMNAPGIYLVHLGVLQVLGGSDLAWRTFDLGWLALTCAVIVGYLRPVGGAASLVSALLFAAYHLAGGPWLAGQRDFLICLFLVGGAALVVPSALDSGLRSVRSGAGAVHRVAAAQSETAIQRVIGAQRVVGLRQVAAGLAVGAAIVLKPPAVVFLLALAAATMRLEPRWRGPLAVLAGAAMIPLACAAWLAATGGFVPFLQMVMTYVLPLYSRLARVWPWTALGWWPYGWRVWGLFTMLVALTVLARWQRPAGPLDVRRAPRRALVLTGLVYGVIHFAVQGKGWEYQLYPLALFACLSAGLAMAAPARAARWGAGGVVALLALTLAAKGAQETAPPWIADKAARVERLVADLRGRLGPEDRVQVLETNHGGVHALFRLRAHQPTRFIYDFHFLHDEDRPAIRALRAEFIGALAAEPPAVIVMLRDGWPSGGYERFERFPELARWLRGHYEISRDAGDYRVYARRASLKRLYLGG